MVKCSCFRSFATIIIAILDGLWTSRRSQGSGICSMETARIIAGSLWGERRMDTESFIMKMEVIIMGFGGEISSKEMVGFTLIRSCIILGSGITIK